MTIQHNKSNGSLNFGDGVVLNAASNNQILNNTITDNGPFSGVTLLKRASNNLIQGNTITDNAVPSTNFAGHPTIMQDDGVRIEGPSARGNRVINNTISRNGLDGVAVFFVAPAAGKSNARNVISGNHIEGNGFNTLTRPGSGILLFSTPSSPVQRTTIQNNTVLNNAANGIEVRSQQNSITNNTATGNGQSSAGFFDLLDTNPNCDQNTWRGNTAGTGSPPCTLTP
jgi:parallel beta-helix repeat protein